MIYLTGDFHNTIDGERIKQEFFSYDGLTREDYLLNCGDFGFIWHGDKRDEEDLQWLSELPVTILFVDGNHENFDALQQYPITTWNGGRVQYIRDNIIHLMRGEVYTIEGKKYFTFGGGTSIDRMYRTEGVSWWPQEIPSQEEFNNGIETLEKNDWKVDYVITHSAPSNVVPLISPFFGKDILNNYLMSIDERLSYTHWYFGHYHKDVDLDAKHTMLYKAFVEVGKTMKEKETKRIIMHA